MRPTPEEHVYEGVEETGWTYTRSKRGVPMAHLQCNGRWASFCWFGKSQLYKVFVNGNGIGCARTLEGLIELVHEACSRLEEPDGRTRESEPG